MIPDTAGALLALLGLVAPGLVFQARREHRRPTGIESAFREASRVALTSLVFTVIGIITLTWLASHWSALPEVDKWIATPSPYFRANYQAVTLYALLEVGIACTLAFITELLTGFRIKGNLVTGSVWYSVLDTDEPKGHTRTWLRVIMQDGSRYSGALRWYAPGNEEERDIALGGSPLHHLRPGKDPDVDTEWEELHETGFDAVILPGSQIRSVSVRYQDQYGAVIQATPVRGITDRLYDVLSGRLRPAKHVEN